MNKAGGFITLHRQILDWGWYKNSCTKIVFLHLLLIANFADGNFEGNLIKRGQVVTSLPSLSAETGLSIQQVRTALSHLMSTGEITDVASRRYRIITITKYDDYQTLTDASTGYQQSNNRLSTDDQQTTNRQSTGYQQQYNNNNNNNNNNKNNNGTMEPHKDTPSDDSEQTFKVFWEQYPKKVAKPDALKAWKKLKVDENLLDKILDGLDKWKRSDDWRRDNGRYIPHASTWLNRRGWEDDIQPASQTPAPVKTVAAQAYTQRNYSDEDAAAWKMMLEEITNDG